MESRSKDYDIPTVYMTGAGSSYNWGMAFARGCKTRPIMHNFLRGKSFAAFLDPSFWHLFEEVKAKGMTYYYGDHAYFGRRRYFKITKNAAQHDCSGISDSKRFDSLKIQIKPWRTGSKILLCPQSDVFHRLYKYTQQQWIDQSIKEIRKYSDRPIEIRYKIGGNHTESLFRDSLKDIHAVVVFTSIAGVQAVLEGVPCFTTAECSSAKFGCMDLSKIESPTRPENRYEMASVLADNQWTLHEIERGEAWAKLR